MSATLNNYALLETVNLGRRAANHHWLLRDISFHLNAGERVGLIGPTGSGKTVLLRALALLDPIQSGEIRFRGQPIINVPLYRRDVIYLHQRPALFPGSVEENLRLPFSFRVHCDDSYSASRIREILAQLELESTVFLAKSIGDLSGGEAQIVALIRALQLQPAVMLFDEPTASLDANSAQRVEAAIQRWHDHDKKNRAYIWVSHDKDQSTRMADRILSMVDGELK